MAQPREDPHIADGEQVSAERIPAALTAGRLVYADGATQTFDRDGTTVYLEHGRPTRGEWYVDGEGRFWSYWPPSYRASYELRWIVENGKATGLSFTERDSRSRFDGRYA